MPRHQSNSSPARSGKRVPPVRRLPVRCACLCVLLGGAGAVAAAQSAEGRRPQKPQGPYCGLYCVFAASHLFNKRADFLDLVKPEYVTSSKGSSLPALRQAAEDQGLQAAVVGRIDSRVLRECPYPVILHVKAHPDSKEYDHYVLYLGTQNARARIFDPPDPIELVAFHELAPRWSGHGLVVSGDPIDVATILSPARRRLGLYGIAGLAGLVITHMICRRFWGPGLARSPRRPAWIWCAQSGALIALAVVTAMAYHLSAMEGFLAHAGVTAGIQRAHVDDFINRVALSSVAQLRGTGVLVVDARSPKAYQNGHLEGAINIPADTGPGQRGNALRGVQRNSRILVYCQTARCPQAKQLSAALIADGFTNVAVVEGGWKEWTAMHPTSATRNSESQS